MLSLELGSLEEGRTYSGEGLVVAWQRDRSITDKTLANRSSACRSSSRDSVPVDGRQHRPISNSD